MKDQRMGAGTAERWAGAGTAAVRPAIPAAGSSFRQGSGACGVRADRRRRRIAALAAVVAIAVAPAQAQDFSIQVRDFTEQQLRVAVPLDRSVLVDTSTEVSRVHVVASHVAGVEAIGPRQLLITGMSYGTTQVVLWGPQSQQSVLEVSVELNLDALQEAVGQIDPQAEVEVSSVMGNIVLTGVVSSAENAQRMAELAQLFLPPSARTGSQTTVQNHLRVSGERQVLLRCTVAEVNRGAVRQLGINGFIAGDDFRDMFAVNQIGSINPINIGAAADANVLGDIPFLTGTEGIPLSPSSTLSLGFPRVQMQLFLQALTNNSLLKVLAEPNLVCISGETASFLAGGEFPIPVPQSTASNAITIEFREFGVRLNFTPLVEAHQRIRLRINPEVSETDFSAAVEIGGFVVPGLTNRSAETTVEVGNGQTIAIAGLLSENIRAVASSIPGIGEVPILGALFRSIEFRKSETELVILVTPEIVAPLHPEQVSPVPGQFLVEPSDFELYFLGEVEGKGAAAGNAPVPAAAPEGAPPDHGGGAGAAPSPESLSIRGAWGYADGKR
ncbi:MAG: pilus assembly protein CpaC [Planctomycetota bacterium]|nr:MAG: pilus assembly protein CpaC [Planctomycetota bacterium]